MENTTVETKQKKYYKVKEYVWVKELKARGRIKALDKENYTATVTYFEGGNLVEKELKFWEITKLRKEVSKPKVRYKGKGLNYSFDQVKQFHEAFNHPVSETPVALTPLQAFIRASFMSEEIDEFKLAAQRLDKDGKILSEEEALVAMADALLDNLYFTLGTMVMMGVKPQEVFDIIQNANMSKLFEDGKPRYREDGKILKPPHWTSPEPLIAAEVQRQIAKTLVKGE